MSSKKRKFSGLSGSEFQLAYDNLLKLKDSLAYEETGEEGSLESIEQQVDALLFQLGSKLEEPRNYNFPSVTLEDLANFNIKLEDILDLKSGSEERSREDAQAGQTQLWSSANLGRHLEFLETRISRVNEASARAWIDAFLFRAATMLPIKRRMAINMEHVIPATSISPKSHQTLSGTVDYTAVVGSERKVESYLKGMNLQEIKANDSFSFFVMEAKSINTVEHIPHVVCEMLACGRHLQRRVLRGALTDGYKWIFLIMTIAEDYNGASVQRSDVLSSKDFNAETWHDSIAAILAYWIDHSCSAMQDDDWFRVPNSTK